MREFFTYLPLNPANLVWGAAVTSTGFVHTRAHSDYPAATVGHPSDHLFTSESGRVLDTWQLLLIQRGSGTFDSQPTGLQPVRAGTVFILFPGVWHRYAPDRASGWTESWIEFEGPVPEKLRASGVLDPRRAVCHPGPQPELTEAMARCHFLARETPPGYADQLSTLALQILALVLTLRDPAGPPNRLDEVIRRARAILIERFDRPPRIRDLARELGVAESHFRRSFKSQTGVSPKQFARNLRLRRVRALLRNTALTITEIAEETGYASPFHLSAEFKSATGMAPSHWRECH